MKRIIAREWLCLLFFILLGSILTILLYFNDNNQFIEKKNIYYNKRQHFYKELTEEYKIKLNEKLEIAGDKIETLNEDKQDQLLNILKEAKKNKGSSNNSNNKDLRIKRLQKNPYYADVSNIEPPPYRMDLKGVIRSVRQDTSKPMSRLQKWADDRRSIFTDTSKPLGTYEQFYAILDIPKERKEFYDNLFFNNSYINDYSSFDILFLQPEKSSIFSNISEFYNHLFSKLYWFQTWLSVLTLYFVFLFIRTIVYSIRVLKQK